MNCQDCNAPMLWAGTFSRGRLECPRCSQEKSRIIVDIGRKKTFAEARRAWLVDATTAPVRLDGGDW